MTGVRSSLADDDVKSVESTYNNAKKLSNKKEDNLYIASDNGLRQFFDMLGGAIGKPIIVSDKAARKRVSGTFNLEKPYSLLKQLAIKTSIIWYDDGNAIYVYDSNEIQSKIVRLANCPFDVLLNFMQETGLYSEQYPPKSNGKSGSFYISGPPIYVELVTAAADYMDSSFTVSYSGNQALNVIKLKNIFVEDRSYDLRGSSVVIPGMASVLKQLFAASGGANPDLANAKVVIDSSANNALQQASNISSANGFVPALPAINSQSTRSAGINTTQQQSKGVIIVGYPGTNSLLIQGSEHQVDLIKNLIHLLDTPKTQIQLSLWIIDISKDKVQNLGVKWQGSGATGGGTFMLNALNSSSLTPTSSLNFLATVNALVEEGDAQVISRPQLLTQENIPAVFDNNKSYYAKLQGERTASLNKVTFGTMISVLPHLVFDDRQIDMILDIQDGGMPIADNGQVTLIDSLPMVNNTQISTQARVPEGYGLLVGGYSLDEDTKHTTGIPYIKDIPMIGNLFKYNSVSHRKMVRLFLIQPKILDNNATWNSEETIDPVLGKQWFGKNVTLSATVKMLRTMMAEKKKGYIN